MDTDYYFGRTDGGDVAGFNDPVAANFAYEENATDSLVREAIQNIIDARLPGNQPARAEFELKHFPVQDLPNPKRLESIFRKCAEYAEKRKVIPAVKHYREQADILKSGAVIPLLRIADYNTCGLTGDTEDGRWFMFMRGVGFNAAEAGAGGAFGLGKGAFFANSLFRTIFVSTLTDEGSKFAGKLRLVSFSQDGELMQGNGTYGRPKQFPVLNKKEIPPIFNRKEKGTDIWVVNYLGSDDWSDAICRAVLGWFWPSIHWGILTVKVGDKEINAQNLRDRMCEFFSPEEQRAYKPHNPLHFFDAYVKPEKKNTEIYDMLGKVSFYGSTSNELPYPNKVARVRNTGMIIDFRGRSSHLTKYAAIFECRIESKKKGKLQGYEILRKLENPAHTEWNWHNWKDEHGHYVEDGKIASQELEEFIADGLSGLLYSPVEQSATIPGLTEHIGVPRKENASPKIGGDNNLVQEPIDEETGIEIGSEGSDENISFSHTVKPIKIRRLVRTDLTEEIDEPTPTPTPGPHVIPPVPPVVVPDGIVLRLQELEDAVVRYVLSDTTSEGRTYRFVIHANNVRSNSVVRMKLFGRAEDGERELLGINNATGERGTKIEGLSHDYCDLYLDNAGKAYLSVELKEPWIVAIDPSLYIKQ